VPVLDVMGVTATVPGCSAPRGVLGYQDKLMMTRFEREQWDIAAQGLQVFDTELGRLGHSDLLRQRVSDAGPPLGRGGADLILAPSCTDTEAGYHRVRIGAQARALENQIAVLQSPTVGWRPGRRRWTRISAGQACSCRRIMGCRGMGWWR
jgi:predicted amidohydrolase